MPKERVVKTKRPGGPKSRNACDGCRRKKIKCDEKKPGCSQCAKSGLACPGYVTKLSWSTKHEVFLEEPSLFRVASLETAKAEPLGISYPQPAATLHPSTPGSSLTWEEEPKEQVIYQVDETWQTNASPSAYLTAESSTSEAPKELSLYQTSAKFSKAAVLQRGNLQDHLDAYKRNFLPKQLTHHPTFLVEGYFRHVCAIFSSFDTVQNPFRTMVEDLWQSWPPLYYAIQSMAAAYLANFSPAFEKAGVFLQHEAYRELSKNLNGSNRNERDDTKIFLTVLLLGLTTAWHSSSDIGTVHIQAARRLLTGLERDRVEEYSPQNLSFFKQCMTYWEMLMVFVWEEPDGYLLQDLEEPAPSTESDQNSIHPHPWTTIAPAVNALFAQVGALVRMNRRRAVFDKSILEFLSFENEQRVSEERARAEELEDRLLSLQMPSQESIIDPQDPNTPASHFMAISEAYRCTALLLIYHVWPEIAETRLPLKEDLPEGMSQLEDPSQPLAAAMGANIKTSTRAKNWLTSLSLHILDILKTLPSTSGTRFLQPIVLLCAANELRPPAQKGDLLDEIDGQDMDVARDRLFVVMRLTELSMALPAKPVVRVRSLVQEVWERMETQDDVFWLDVMLEMGWETIVG